MSSISLSFLQSTCSYSNLHQQQKLLFSQPSLISDRKTRSLKVEASARTRQDNRQARHARIRKKVTFLLNPNSCCYLDTSFFYSSFILGRITLNAITEIGKFKQYMRFRKLLVFFGGIFDLWEFLIVCEIMMCIHITHYSHIHNTF